MVKLQWLKYYGMSTWIDKGDQRKRIEMDPKTYESLTYDKGASWISGAKTEFLFKFFKDWLFNKW